MSNSADARTLLQRHSTSVLRGIWEQSNAIATLEHDGTKGRIRELFVARSMIRPFLAAQFGIGTGIVINQTGDQSPQQDIIIYDTRVLPPFILEADIGVFPIEAVIGTIEVKSDLNKGEAMKAEDAARRVADLVCGTIYEDLKELVPSAAIIGFKTDGLGCNPNSKDSEAWLTDVFHYIKAVCVINRYSWVRLTNPNRWVCDLADGDFSETKAFLSVYLDNLRRFADARLQTIANATCHRDFLSAYLRSDSSAARTLRGHTLDCHTSSSSTADGGTITSAQPPWPLEP